MAKEIRIEKKVLSENERLAAELRNKMVLNGVLSLNIVSSPGALFMSFPHFTML